MNTSRTPPVLRSWPLSATEAPSVHAIPYSTPRKMMFFNDDHAGTCQIPLNQQIPQFLAYNQSPVLPHAVASVGRTTPLNLRRERSPHYLAASSSSRTAKSGQWRMMPPKRTASGSPSGTPGKTIKSEQKPEDFSNSVKKRLQSSTRTGQACDRCKVRKIRCDGLLGGCSPCIQNQTECRTTDRITGRAAPRGYVENLENQNRDMANRIQELERLLIQNGIDVKPSNVHYDSAMQAYNYTVPGQNGHGHIWGTGGQSNSYSSATAGTTSGNSQQETNLFRALPAFRSGCTGDNYLGVSSGNSHLSSIKGTALSILGMEIDIADFPSQDMDEPDPSGFHPALYNKSYQAFLQSALNINPNPSKVDLPGREEGLTYAQWYFRVINPFCPILHKASFMSLLTRFYDDPHFRPSTAQTVVVHMVFAIMFFQYATRNWEDSVQQSSLTAQSNLHYHYSLSMFYQLLCSHTWQDVQALTMICIHLRNFPKPGASWILTSITLSLAIELGMHRSVKRWAAEQTPNALDTDLRKRTWWSILIIHVTLSGKLGRPMPLKITDFDVEYPDPIDDDLLTEAGVDTSRPGRCIHSIGITAWKLGPLFMELYDTIYAVRRSPENYIQTVNRLEAGLQSWIDNRPSEIIKGESGFNEQEGRIFGLYAQIWALEFRLLLRHPSVSMTLDPAFNAESMKICLDSSRQMLSIVVQLQKLKSLDTTWYNTSVYVMAITVTLFAQWEKRNETTAADLAALRAEMDTWLDIMGELGNLLGSGNRLREAVRNVTDGTIGLLSRSLQHNAGYISHTGNHDMSAKSPHRRKSSSVNSNNQSYPNYGSSFMGVNGTNGGSGSSGYMPPDSQMTHQQTPYPAATQYSSYPDPTNNSSINYSTQDSHPYSAYPAATTDSVEAPLLAAFAAQAASQNASSNSQWGSHHRPLSEPQANPVNSSLNSGSQSWQQWTSTMAAGNLEPQDRYSASALMQLGGRDHSVPDAAAPMADMMGASGSGVITGNEGSIGGVHPSGGIAWPLNIFDIGSSGNGN